LGAVDLCLKNAKIPYRGLLVEAGVAIDKGKIVAVHRSRLPPADKTVNLRGSLLLPGIVDVHVHFRDPGLTWKEDFASGSRAAASGGVTTVCDMPNCVPPTNSLKRFKEKIKIARSKSHVDFGLHAALPDDVGEGAKLEKAGAASFKVYTESQGDSEIPDFLGLGLTISAHAEAPDVLKKFKPRGKVIEEFIRCRPKLAEISEIARLLRLVHGAPLHLCHVTTSESINLIAKAKRAGEVTCEATPHHLLLSSNHLRKLGPLAQTLPPLRSPADRIAVLMALRNGTIDIVASDHAPHTLKEKKKGKMNIWESPPGIAGVETSLPLIHTLVRKRRLSIFRLVEAMCTMPAKTFGLRGESGMPKGVIKPGADADFVALDQRKKWKIKGEELHGKTKFTPFEGYGVIGKPFMTLVRGEVVFEDGEVVGKAGYGRFIPRSSS